MHDIHAFNFMPASHSQVVVEALAKVASMETDLGVAHKVVFGFVAE